MKNEVFVLPEFKIDGVLQNFDAPIILGSKSPYSEIFFNGLPDYFYAGYNVTINGDNYLFVISEDSKVEIFSKDYPEIISPTTNTGRDHRIFITKSEITGGMFRHGCAVIFTDLIDCFLISSEVNNYFPSKFKSDKKPVYSNLQLTNSNVINSVLPGGGDLNCSRLDGVTIKIPAGDYGLYFSDLNNVSILGKTALLELDDTEIGDSDIKFEEQLITNSLSIVNLTLHGDSIKLTDIYSLFTIPTEFDNFIVYEDGKGGWGLSGSSENSNFTNTRITTLEEVTKFVVGSMVTTDEPEEIEILESIAQLIWDSYVSRKRLLARIRGNDE